MNTDESMTETTIIIIRHGETQWNIKGRWQGHLNSELTDCGVEQAEAAGQGLMNYQFSRIYSSDLGRAVQTADIISEITQKKIIFDKRLRERNLGIFQGLTMPEMGHQYPEEFQKFSSLDPDFIIPGGESARQVVNRSTECFFNIANNHDGETIVVVTHGGILSSFLRHVLGIPFSTPRKFKIWNASINIFVYQNHQFEVHTFGNTHHLNRIDTLDEETTPMP